MREFKRSPRIKEKIKLGDDIIEVNLEASAISADFIKGYNAVAIAENALKESKSSQAEEGIASALEAYGNAVIAILKIVFGEKDTLKILEFYEHDYGELLTEVFPFLIEEVYPKIKESAAIRAERIKAIYKVK